MAKRRAWRGAFIAWFAILPKTKLGWQFVFRRFSLWRSMMKSASRGEADFPWGTVIAVVVAVSYTLMPLDIIPDFFLILGWLDDAFVTALCFKFVKRDLRKYITQHEIDPEPFGL